MQFTHNNKAKTGITNTHYHFPEALYIPLLNHKPILPPEVTNIPASLFSFSYISLVYVHIAIQFSFACSNRMYAWNNTSYILLCFPCCSLDSFCELQYSCMIWLFSFPIQGIETVVELQTYQMDKLLPLTEREKKKKPKCFPKCCTNFLSHG